MKKRKLFSELMAGIDDMRGQRSGKTTLRHTPTDTLATPVVTSAEIIALRKKMRMSQEVFARRIRTSTETLRNWEQEKSRPNAQAALLIKLVKRYPDMVERLASV